MKKMAIARLVLFSSLLFISDNVMSQYCSAGSSTTCDEYISNFNLNTINNTSNCNEGGYVSYSFLNTSLTKGLQYTASITPAIFSQIPIPAIYTSDEIAIWIDYNGDADFTDAGEQVGYVLSTGTAQVFQFNFTVPVTASAGLKRLRTRISYQPSGAIVPCGFLTYGETEDYSVNIVENITPPSSPSSVSSSSSTVCTGQSVALTASGTQGTTYWFSGNCGNSTASAIGTGSSINVSPTITTTYYARNYSNGLWSSNCAATTVTISSLPSSPANPTSNSPQCQTATITRTGSPVANVTWYWQGTSANGTSTSLGSGATYTASTSGTYYIRAKNSSGCWSQNSASTNVVISGYPSAPASISSNSPNCGTVTLYQTNSTPSGVTWYWQGSNSNGTSTSFSSNTYTANSSGTYYQRARNTANCWSQNSTSIAVNVTSSNVYNQNQNACGSYTWINGVTYTNNTNAQIVLPNAGVGGCDSVILLNLTLHPNYSTIDEVNACESYTWINGITYIQNNNSAAFLLQSAYGCDSLVRLNLTFGEASDTSLIQSSAVGSYVLNNIVYNSSGTYFQNLQNQYGCDSTIQLNLFVEAVSLEDISSNTGGLIFPNPSSSGIFQLKQLQNLKIIAVKDLLGQDLNPKLEKDRIDLSNYPRGTYMVLIELEGRYYNLRLVNY